MSAAVVPADRVPDGPEAGPRFNPIAWRNQRRIVAAEHAAQVRDEAGDRRDLLRAVHAERQAAEADVARLRETLGRARDHLAEVVARQAAAEAAGIAADDAAAVRLAAVLAAGEVPAIIAPARPAPAKRERQIAEVAVARIGDEFEHAEQRLTAAGQRVREAAWRLLEDAAAERAHDMLIRQQSMRGERAELEQLWKAVHGLTQQLFGEPVEIVAAVFRAVQAADPPPVWRSNYPGVAPPEPPNPWVAVFTALVDDPEATLPG